MCRVNIMQYAIKTMKKYVLSKINLQIHILTVSSDLTMRPIDPLTNLRFPNS